MTKTTAGDQRENWEKIQAEVLKITRAEWGKEAGGGRGFETLLFLSWNESLLGINQKHLMKSRNAEGSGRDGRVWILHVQHHGQQLLTSVRNQTHVYAHSCRYLFSSVFLSKYYGRHTVQYNKSLLSHVLPQLQPNNNNMDIKTKVHQAIEQAM